MFNLKKEKKKMKKIMMTIAAAFVATAMNAQGYIGGSLGFQTSSYDGESTTTWKIMPEVGYNINDSWAIGTTIGYGQSGKGDDKVKTFTVSPYARLAVAKLSMVNVFIDGGVGYSFVEQGGAKVNEFNVGLKPGVALNLNDKLSFVAHFGFLGYQNDKVKGDDKSINTFGLNLDNNVSFGLYLNF